MNKRIINTLCLLLCAAHTCGLCACSRLGKEDEPELTPPSVTEEVIDHDDMPTEIPQEEAAFTFNNDLGTVVAGLYVNEWWEDWSAGEPIKQGIAIGGTEHFMRGEIFGEGNAEHRYHLGVKDPTGTSYYLYDIELYDKDVVTVTAMGDGAAFTITRDGVNTTYPAVEFTDSMPRGRSAGMISVNRIHYEGVGLAEGAYEGGSGLCTLEYELIELNNADVMSFPQLAAALLHERNARVQQISEDYAAKCAGLQESGSGRAQYCMEAVVRRADSRLLSILYICSYTHGGVTDVTFDSVNFDPETGEKLSLADVTDCTGLTELINDALAEEGSDISLPMPTEGNENEHFLNPNSACWTYDHDGVTLYFTMNGEPVSVMLPIDELPGADAGRIPETENYTVGLSLGLPSRIMINGRPAELTINEYGRPGEGRMAEIVLDGEAHRFDLVHLTEIDAEAMYLFAHVNGRDFVYVLGSNYANGCELDVVELGSSRIYLLGSMGCLPHAITPTSGAAEGGTGRGIELITDPAMFSLDFDNTILGTCIGSTSVGIGGSCLPRRYNDICMLREPWPEYTLLCDLEADMVSEIGGGKAGSITLHEGEKVSYICSAEGRYAYLMTEDEEIARVDVECEGVWPHTIGGVPVEEIFQGIVWVG